jgi:rare lipoprotein A (peptidoglycan hydrolase)
MIVSAQMIALFLAGVGAHFKEIAGAGRALTAKPTPELAPPMRSALASFYYDQGQTASGFHAFYGVANRYLRFGTRVLFAYHGRSVLATVDDRGPFIGGRTWDLNQNVAGALSFAGVDVVSYRIGG